MPWAPDYATLAEIKSFIRIPDTDDDAQLAIALAGASRSIDAHAGRQFGVLSSAAPRYYTGYRDVELSRYVAVIDDVMTTTGMVVRTDPTTEGTFDNTFTLDTDFRLAPYNATANGRPWTMIVLSAGGTLSRRPRSLEISAKWGWTAVPDAVKNATVLQASRIFARRNAPFGIAGSPESGSELRLLTRLDPDVVVLLRDYRRFWGAV